MKCWIPHLDKSYCWLSLWETINVMMVFKLMSIIDHNNRVKLQSNQSLLFQEAVANQVPFFWLPTEEQNSQFKKEKEKMHKTHKRFWRDDPICTGQPELSSEPAGARGAAKRRPGRRMGWTGLGSNNMKHSFLHLSVKIGGNDRIADGTGPDCRPAVSSKSAERRWWWPVRCCEPSAAASPFFSFSQ